MSVFVFGVLLLIISNTFAFVTEQKTFLTKKELTIGYQSHSINDLREWKQLIQHKHTNWLKIDFYFEPSVSTQHFLMTHNSPTKRVPFYYNEEDFLRYISEFGHMFQVCQTIFILCQKKSNSFFFFVPDSKINRPLRGIILQSASNTQNFLVIPMKGRCSWI